MLGISEGTSKSQLYHAKKQLQKLLKGGTDGKGWKNITGKNLNKRDRTQLAVLSKHPIYGWRLKKNYPTMIPFFRSALQELPTKEAPDVWLPIESKLTGKEEPRTHMDGRSISCICLWQAWPFSFNSDSGGENLQTISYGTENVENFNVGLDIGSLHALVRTNC